MASDAQQPFVVTHAEIVIAIQRATIAEYKKHLEAIREAAEPLREFVEYGKSYTDDHGLIYKDFVRAMVEAIDATAAPADTTPESDSPSLPPTPESSSR